MRSLEAAAKPHLALFQRPWTSHGCLYLSRPFRWKGSAKELAFFFFFRRKKKQGEVAPHIWKLFRSLLFRPFLRSLRILQPRVWKELLGGGGGCTVKLAVERVPQKDLLWRVFLHPSTHTHLHPPPPRGPARTFEYWKSSGFSSSPNLIAFRCSFNLAQFGKRLSLVQMLQLLKCSSTNWTRS